LQPATPCDCSLDGLLLLSEPEGVEGHAGDLDDLETHSRKISHGVAGTTEPGNEDLVVLVDEGHTTVSGHEASDSLVVFLELDSHALSHGGVRLLGLDGDLLDHDAGGVRRTLEGLSPLGVLVRLVVVVIGPSKSEDVEYSAVVKGSQAYLFNLL
jgi:hypothetical protein